MLPEWRKLILPEEKFEALYRDHMQVDFPPAELKPLSRMLALQASGHYGVCTYGAVDDMQAYACFYADERAALLDYFAVVRGRRAQGWGSQALAALLQHHSLKTGLILECEDPDLSANMAEARLRRRRIHFYERLGFTDSGIRATIFGTPYWVLERGRVDDVRGALAYVYGQFVPDRVHYEANVFIH